MPTRMFRMAVVAGALGCGFFGVPAAAEVVLRLPGASGATVSGELLDHDGEYFRLRTPNGLVTLRAEGVTCSGAGCPSGPAPVGRLAFSGARPIAEALLPQLLAAFAQARGLTLARRIDDASHATYLLSDAEGQRRAEIAVRATSTAEGIADLLAEEADLALAVRPASAREAAMLREAGLGDLTRPAQSRILGYDALAAVVAPGNPLRAATLGDLARVLDGTAFSWSALGGREAPIHLFLPPRRDGAETTLPAPLAGSGRTPSRPAAPATRPADAATLGASVAADPLALGLIRLSAAGPAVPLALGGPCGAAVDPRPETLRSGDYPLTTVLRLYLPGRRMPPLARTFLTWSDSTEAQAIVTAAGFVGLGLDPVPLAANGARLAAAIRAAEGAAGLERLKGLLGTIEGGARLPLSLRFAQDTPTDPDETARAGLRLLGKVISAGHFDGQQLLFVGFSDASGAPEADLSLARERAEGMRAAAERAAGRAGRDRVPMRALGFGPFMPVACDDTAWGREINRRVEVWLVPQR